MEQEFLTSEAQGRSVLYREGLKSQNSVSRKDLLTFRVKHDHPAAACLDGQWKLICHMGRREDELYDLKLDPREKVNLVNMQKDALDLLHQKPYERFVKSSSRPLMQDRKNQLPLEAKKAITEIVLVKAFDNDWKPLLVCTGGKDSTLVLYQSLEVARRGSLKMPPLLFVDHGQHFPETWSFLKGITKREGLEMIVAMNDDLLAEADDDLESVPLDALDAANQEEALKAGLQRTEVPLSLDSPVGSHLLKTVALNRALRRHDFDTAITGIRWDENPARSAEVFFSPREEPPPPPHMRVHTILPWTKREVWEYTLNHTLPIHPFYRRGYRSFDGVRDSKPTDTRPAWEQDLEASAERAGRAQDKEEIMERLRALGYF